MLYLVILGWAKAEHLEIAAYRGMEKAHLIGNHWTAQPLQQILSDE